ncbi:RNA polymerase subunit sigma-24 [Knoellia flava TL1]|uniref:RNA polymerase sigma24 factor n=2 Tax=Knoellia flava TaxID=913969 RepID=A0A8H9KPT3_9MICO|nr:SigE family RNA polymerase sigma factor [Knoellia flava]KGN30106.1 RNA polymerase subunit sigma-24 [Knoellia flava TL1]GGB72598.1 RNA polymerase sigma24 factor [Knoellia flava]
MDRDPDFTAYVMARRPQLYRTAVLLCGDPHRAEDVVQDALVRLYAVWPRVASIGNVDAYVRRVIVNAHLSDRRRPWRRESPRELPDTAMAPGFGFEETDAVRAAIRRLPPGQRRVVVLRHIWGLSVEQTAQELGISTGTVKSQTADALASLRQALSPAYESTTPRRGEDR